MLKILAAADLHGDRSIAERLSKKALKNNIELIILAGDIFGALKETDASILNPFVENNQKVSFVLGNWESIDETNLLKQQSNAKNLENYYITYNNVGIAGIGHGNWKLVSDEIGFQNVKRNFERMEPSKKILVSHNHAEGSKAEFSGFRGDKILRKAVDILQPDILISAHIHEAEGIEEKIGKTKIIQVGRKGTIIEL